MSDQEAQARTANGNWTTGSLQQQVQISGLMQQQDPVVAAKTAYDQAVSRYRQASNQLRSAEATFNGAEQALVKALADFKSATAKVVDSDPISGSTVLISGSVGVAVNG